jgi:hypothetical protein
MKVNSFGRIIVLLCACFAAWGQDTRGSISATVVDPSGAAVPSAKVTVLNTGTGVSVDAQSAGGTGNFAALYLIPGRYTVTVEAPGFKKLVREGIELRLSERLVLELRLEVGQTQDLINVTAEAPLLELGTATSGQIIDRRRITELPLAEGNPLTLVQQTPGIAIFGGFTSNSALSSSGPSNFEVNGSPGGNEFTLDGAPNTADRAGNGAARVGLQPPTDAVEEFKVVTASFDAQTGRTAGGVVDVAVRSGTNDLHGTLYHFVRNDILSANTFFNNRQDVPRPVRRYNRFGGTAGGPVWIPKVYNGKNKTFWFTSYEKIRPITPNFETLTLPTEDFRRGDFSSLANRPTPLLIYDPLTARRDGARVVRDPISCGGRINVICPSRISPITAQFLSFLPLPNTNLDQPTNNYFGNAPGDNRYYVFIARGDHQFNDKNRMFVRYSKSYRTEIDENSTGTVNGVRANGRLGNRGNDSIVADYVYVHSASTVLNLRGSLARFIQDRIALADLDFDLRQMGFSPQALALFTANTLPQMNITNYSNLVEPTGFNITTPTWAFQPTLTHFTGAHSLKFGYDYRVYQQNRREQTFRAGQYNFGNNWTRLNDQNPSLPLEQIQGQSLASALLGLPTGGNFPLLADNASTAKYHSFFFQDDWKVTRKLTLNLGLRYEVDLGTTERYNRIIRDFDTSLTSPAEAAARANYALSPIPEIAPANFRLRGGLLFADENNRAAFRADRNNWQPRIGGAYQINNKTVIRAGWAMFMVPFVIDGINQNGFSRNTPLVASDDLGLTFRANLANPFPQGYIAEIDRGPGSLLGQNLGTIVPTNRKNGMVQRWNFSLQRELPGRWLIDMTYTGNSGNDLLTGVNGNPVFREYQSTLGIRDQALINFLDTPVSNPFRGVAEFAGTGLFTNTVINRRQLLRPYPHFGNFTLERYDGTSSFHSGQVRVEKRFSQGYTVLGSYTWSKFLEAVSLLNDTDPVYERRLNENDVPHRFSMSGIYELPFGRGRKFGANWSKGLNLLAGGWQVQGLFQYQGGLPLTLGNVYFQGNLSDLNPRINSGTIGVLGGNNIFDNVFLTDIRTTGFYLTDATMQVNGVLDYTRQRNDTRIQLADNIRTLQSRAANWRQQAIMLLDMSVIKNFNFTERVYLQFRAEAINAPNRVHFFAPVINPRDANFGRVTNTDSPTLPREFQLGLRLVF